MAATCVVRLRLVVIFAAVLVWEGHDEVGEHRDQGVLRGAQPPSRRLARRDRRAGDNIRFVIMLPTHPPPPSLGFEIPTWYYRTWKYHGIISYLVLI